MSVYPFHTDVEKQDYVFAGAIYGNIIQAILREHVESSKALLSFTALYLW
jgi:hypothetical protein